MSTENWVEYLKISTMVTFHVFILIAIILAIFMFFAVRSIQKKVIETLDNANDAIDNVKEAAFNIGDAGVSFADFITPFIFSRRGSKSKGVLGLIGKFFGR